MKIKSIKYSILLFFVLLTLAMASTFTAYGENNENLPKYGYQLIIDGDGGCVFADGVELQSGCIVDAGYGTEVYLFASPDDGYVVREWTYINTNNGSTGSYGNQILAYFSVSSFLEIHVSFEQKTSFKLYYKCLYGEEDVTRLDDYHAIGGSGASICTIWTAPASIPLDDLFEDFYSIAQISGAFDMFERGLEYFTFDPEDPQWIIMIQDLYPSFNYSTNRPRFLGTGFTVSDESMIALSRSERSPIGDFEGSNIIVLRLYGDVHVVSEIRDIGYSAITVGCDTDKGNVTITPKRKMSPNYWYEETTITVKAKPKDGYRFVRWEDTTGSTINVQNVNSNPLVFLLGAENVELYAVFEAAIPNYRPVTSLSDPLGKAVIKVNGSEDISTAEEGTTVHIGVQVDDYYVFDRWEVFQNNIDYQNNLVAPSVQNVENAEFEMPYGEEGVTVKAILKDRYTPLKSLVNLGENIADTGLVTFTYRVNGNECLSSSFNVQKGDTISVDVVPVDSTRYEIDCLRVITRNGESYQSLFNADESHTEFIINEWVEYFVYCVIKEVQQVEPNKPIISDGRAERTGIETATVYFNSSMGGKYYYNVVAAGHSTAVATDDPHIGFETLEGTNVIMLSGLSPGAKALYIKVKSTEGVVSDLYKIEIPDYKDEPIEETYYSINLSIPKGGTLICSSYAARAGDIVTISVVPDNGYYMVEGSLVYTRSVSSGEVVNINANSFVMPDCDVIISCRWEKVSEDQPDESVQYWNNIATVFNSKPWWVYADEQSVKNNYPIYW